MKKFKNFTSACRLCESEFTYQRRIQIQERYAGRWMGRPRIICSAEKCQQATKCGVRTPSTYLKWLKKEAEKRIKTIKRKHNLAHGSKERVLRKRMKDKRGNYVTKREIAMSCFKLLGIPMLDEYMPTKRGGVALTTTGFRVLETEIAAMVVPIRDREILVDELLAIVEELNDISAEESLSVSVTFRQE